MGFSGVAWRQIKASLLLPLNRLTLIRERLPGATTAERPPLTVDDLVGEWQGEGVTIYPDGRSPDTYPTTLRVDKNGEHQLTQQLTFNADGRRDAYPTTRNISSTARIEGSILYFEEAPNPIKCCCYLMVPLPPLPSR